MDSSIINALWCIWILGIMMKSWIFILLLYSSGPCSSICSCKPDPRPEDKPNCDENEEEIFQSQCAASILSDLFKPCHSLIPPEAFLGNCVYDMCEYDGMLSTLCDNIEAYAQACYSAGIKISWRNSTFCRKWKKTRTENVMLSWVTAGRNGLSLNMSENHCHFKFNASHLFLLCVFISSSPMPTKQSLFWLHSSMSSYLCGPLPRILPITTQ